MPKARAMSLLFVVLLLSCGSSDVRRFDYREDAGSVHVAVQSVAPFDSDFIQEMQFPLQVSDTEASNAIAQSRLLEILEVRKLLLEIARKQEAAAPAAPAPAGGAATNSTTPASGTAGATNTTTGSTPSTQNAATQDASRASGFDVLAAPDNLQISLDPALNFRANLALRQEIALLNRQVRDAAVAADTRPYVIRFLVTVFPAARKEPYDTYSTISVFSDQQRTAPVPLFVRNPQQNKLVGDLIDKVRPQMCNEPLEVVPLFVTDNLESSFNNVAFRNELALEAENVGRTTTAGIDASSDRRRRAQSRNLNALSAVARISSNTIEARLGAMQSDTEWETVARTYNVTALVLVPTLSAAFTMVEDEVLRNHVVNAGKLLTDEILPCRGIAFTSTFRFTDSRTGRTLQGASHTTVPYVVEELRVNSFPQFDRAAMESLLNDVRNDDHEGFEAQTMALSAAERRVLWNSLVNANRRSGHSSGRISVPQTESLLPLPFNRQGTLIDDGKEATLTLTGGRKLSTSGLEASLTFGGHTVAATSVAASADGRRVTVKFPSPKRLTGDTNHVYVAQVEHHRGLHDFESQFRSRWIGTSDYESGDQNTARLTYLYVESKEDAKPEPPVILRLSAKHIVAKETLGTIAVTFVAKNTPAKEGEAENGAQVPAKVRFAVDGAHIVSATPAIVVDNGDHIAETRKTYVFTLQNLNPKKKVRIDAFVDKDNARGDRIGKTEELEVIAIEPEKKETAEKKKEPER